ncbi:MAG: putative baseplate assembly protein [Candidatus Tectomicrobia bacterium]|uniref:Baseplate assembly protein n=1 Tax=Tectimicrobiota bacterium TaxID=2528274 RepID=A0A932CPS2_UNCTE|nr:putative baseplate assembly protein [Candidatus Tectomicrobia bacterium]
MIYFCCDERRRNAVKAQTALNGIEFLEVLDNPADPYEKRQRTLLVHFIHDLAPGALKKENVQIEGGERIRPIRVARVTLGGISSPPSGSPPLGSPPLGGPANLLVVEVAEPGDFSVYTLRLVQDARHPDPPAGFDPILSAVDFSFKVACPSDFDCQPQPVCPTEPGLQPEINYLAKDYASFRQLMLDRLAALMPSWKERTPADLGMVLVELLAYVGDYLSYQQDAVATEAYLGTARRRVSVRRHARLVDYGMHDGCNARAWVQVRVGADNVKLAQGTQIFTRLSDQATRIRPPAGSPPTPSLEYERALAARPVIFETMHEATLFAVQNEMEFYTWGDERCCLLKGATRATLKNEGGRITALAAGDVLIFVEQRNPTNGNEQEADPAHRHAVRLTAVKPATDPLFHEAENSSQELRVLKIEWAREDALPFPLCLWEVSVNGDPLNKQPVSVALGNIVLADHGQTITGESLGAVPEANPVLDKVPVRERDFCQERAIEPTPPRFRPRLLQKPLTHAALPDQVRGRPPDQVRGRPYDPKKPPSSASAVMRCPLQEILPEIALTGELAGSSAIPDRGPGQVWEPQRDLLNSNATQRAFVVEVETDGTAFIRFGDDRFGSRPAAGTTFTASYRVGNGVPGNVGAETLVHIVSREAAILEGGVSNPLPAQGGIEPEEIEQVRQNAPSAFRIQERAVTPEDYAEVALRCEPGLQRAAATFRWTGSWRTVFLTVDRLGGEEVDEALEGQIRQCLERYRMAGHDLEVDGPRYVSLEIEMVVCVKPGYFTSHVKAALLERFSNRILPDGQRGVFHPDNFTFGQTVYLSPLYQAAQTLAGVDSVEITKFQRQGIPSQEALDAGKLELGRLEIARLDNDPNFPERGVFNLILKG